MNILTAVISIAILIVIGTGVLAVAGLLILGIVVTAYKIGKTMIALLNAAFKEPEEKIVARIKKLNKVKAKVKK